ncbi:MAG TPA: D-alanyl-D-alanine carboxypeptidase family protein [Thermodesulfovibrionales bacterium]|nr:D-alanyl-D-alanine carboxypeptidase family protein [Thermodesulfovibrionales bacterium]
MKEQCKVQSAGFKARCIKFKVLKRSIFASIFFLLPTLHVLCLTVHAAEISAKAAVVMEASTGRILYGKNPNLRLAPASTTKLMTVMVALDRMNLADTVVISDKAAGISPVKANLRAGERVTLETLVNAALIKSANDAAYALAEATSGSEERFVELMNQKVIALAMSDTKFINATGLPGHGQYTTAYDLSKMLRQALRYPLIKEVINTKASRISTEDGREIFIKNSNRLLWADETMLGGKTGYTREAKHCFVCASEQGSGTVIVALLGASSRERLWKESEELLEKGFAIINGKEEPVMFFTKSDYRDSVRPAAYSVKTSEVRETVVKKARKTVRKKTKGANAGRHAEKHKSKFNANAEAKGADANKG